MLRHASRLAAATLLAMASAACGSKAVTQTNNGNPNNTSGGILAGKTVTLGALAPLSGSYSQIGSLYDNGIQAAVKWVNDNGGILGGTLAVEVVDGGDPDSDPNAILQVATSLVAEHQVPAIIGPTFDSQLLALAPWAQQNEVPIVGIFTSSAAIAQYHPRKYVWRSIPDYTNEAKVTALDMHKQNLHSIVAFIEDNGDSSRAGQVRAIGNLLLALDGNTTVHEIHYAAQNDYSTWDPTPYLNDAAAHPSDVVYYYGSQQGQDSATLHTQLKNSSRNSTFYVSAQAAGMAVQVNADTLRGLRLIAAGFTETSDQNAVGDAFIHWSGQDNSPSGPEQVSMVTALWLALALQKAGDVSGQAIAENMRGVADPEARMVGPVDFHTAYQEFAAGHNINWRGIGGPFVLDENNDPKLAMSVFVCCDNPTGWPFNTPVAAYGPTDY